ncbi:hypothetical protein FOA52_007675 [Chlamydomonas sp. UWO 241]|nr:hypothetical protein FOA52_007675 [Chlamydomonas sp. UWO 241]
MHEPWQGPKGSDHGWMSAARHAPALAVAVSSALLVRYTPWLVLSSPKGTTYTILTAVSALSVMVELWACAPPRTLLLLAATQLVAMLLILSAVGWSTQVAVRLTAAVLGLPVAAAPVLARRAKSQGDAVPPGHDDAVPPLSARSSTTRTTSDPHESSYPDAAPCGDSAAEEGEARLMQLAREMVYRVSQQMPVEYKPLYPPRVRVSIKILNCHVEDLAPDWRQITTHTIETTLGLGTVTQLHARKGCVQLIAELEGGAPASGAQLLALADESRLRMLPSILPTIHERTALAGGASDAGGALTVQLGSHVARAGPHPGMHAARLDGAAMLPPACLAATPAVLAPRRRAKWLRRLSSLASPLSATWGGDAAGDGAVVVRLVLSAPPPPGGQLLVQGSRGELAVLDANSALTSVGGECTRGSLEYDSRLPGSCLPAAPALLTLSMLDPSSGLLGIEAHVVLAHSSNLVDELNELQASLGGVGGGALHPFSADLATWCGGGGGSGNAASIGLTMLRFCLSARLPASFATLADALVDVHGLAPHALLNCAPGSVPCGGGSEGGGRANPRVDDGVANALQLSPLHCAARSGDVALVEGISTWAASRGVAPHWLDQPAGASAGTVTPTHIAAALTAVGGDASGVLRAMAAPPAHAAVAAARENARVGGGGGARAAVRAGARAVARGAGAVVRGASGVVAEHLSWGTAPVGPINPLWCIMVLAKCVAGTAKGVLSGQHLYGSAPLLLWAAPYAALLAAPHAPPHTRRALEALEARADVRMLLHLHRSVLIAAMAYGVLPMPFVFTTMTNVWLDLPAKALYTLIEAYAPARAAAVLLLLDFPAWASLLNLRLASPAPVLHAGLLSTWAFALYVGSTVAVARLATRRRILDSNARDKGKCAS